MNELFIHFLCYMPIKKKTKIWECLLVDGCPPLPKKSSSRSGGQAIYKVPKGTSAVDASSLSREPQLPPVSARQANRAQANFLEVFNFLLFFLLSCITLYYTCRPLFLKGRICMHCRSNCFSSTKIFFSVSCRLLKLLRTS